VRQRLAVTLAAVDAETVGLVERELVGLGRVGLQRDLVAPEQILPRLAELVGRDRHVAEASELGEHPFDRAFDDVRGAREIDAEDAGIDALGCERRHAVREPLAIAELEEEPAALARQDRLERLQDGAIGVGDAAAAHAEYEVRLLAVELGG
jgi:hypothetical protein